MPSGLKVFGRGCSGGDAAMAEQFRRQQPEEETRFGHVVLRHDPVGAMSWRRIS
jgi:hypothetical protein